MLQNPVISDPELNIPSKARYSVFHIKGKGKTETEKSSCKPRRLKK